jgi:hypothetical protein
MEDKQHCGNLPGNNGGHHNRVARWIKRNKDFFLTYQFVSVYFIFFAGIFYVDITVALIRALSPTLAVKSNISPGRWQHFPLWLLFLQRDKGKRKKMTGTQHVGTLKHTFIHYITIKTVLVIVHYQNNILVFCTSVI